MGKTSLPPDRSRSVLLVIDVQQALFERSTPIFHAERLLDTINSMITFFRESGRAVVFVQHENNKILLKGTPGWKIHSELHREESDPVIYKQHGNAFEQTGLQELLDSCGVDTIVIAGLVSNGCIRATCLGALDLGFQVILTADGHSSWHKDIGKIIVKINREMEEAGVEVFLAEQITML